MAKVLIIGGGPAGLSAAYYWSKEGYHIDLFEASPKERYPEKPCGEAIPKDALRHIPIEKSEYVLNYIKGAEMYMYGKFVRKFQNMPLLDGYIIDKKKMLLLMAEAAESMGAHIHWGKKLSISNIKKLLDDYDYILDASGKGNIARYYLDYKKYEMIPVAQAYARGGDLRDDTLILWGLDYGYGWVFPRGDIFNIGIGGYANVQQLLADLEDMVKYFGLEITSKIRFATVSVGGPIKRLIRGKIRVLGESAGMVMPTTGEGIRFAMYSGKIVLSDNYEKIFWREYGKKIERGRKLLKYTLRIKNKYRLVSIASEKDMYGFFEGTLKTTRLLILGLKYFL